MKNRYIITIVFASIVIGSNFCMAMQRHKTNRGATDGTTEQQDYLAFAKQAPEWNEIEKLLNSTGRLDPFEKLEVADRMLEKSNTWYRRDPDPRINELVRVLRNSFRASLFLAFVENKMNQPFDLTTMFRILHWRRLIPQDSPQISNELHRFTERYKTHGGADAGERLGYFSAPYQGQTQEIRQILMDETVIRVDLEYNSSSNKQKEIKCRAVALRLYISNKFPSRGVMPSAPVITKTAAWLERLCSNPAFPTKVKTHFERSLLLFKALKHSSDLATTLDSISKFNWDSFPIQ